MFSKIIFLSVLIIFIYFFVKYFVLHHRRQRTSKTVNSMPGPRTFPFIGSAYCLLQKNIDEKFIDVVTQMTKDYSSPFQFWMGNKLMIFVHEPDQIKTILKNKHCLNKSVMYKFMEPIFGNGILTTPESTWSQQRKMILPIFSKTMLRRFFDIFVEESLKFTDKLDKGELNKNEIIFFEHISKSALNTACVTLMDIKLEPLLISQFIEAISSLEKLGAYRMQNIFLYPDFIFNIIIKQWNKSLNFLHFFTDKIIQETYMLNKLYTKNKSKIDKTLFDILMESSDKEKFSIQDDFKKMIYDNVLTLLLEAFDTNANTLTFVVLMLANFPEIQEKVYKELCEIYGTKHPKFTSIKYEDLQRMNYLDSVIKETMRLFPVVPFIGRQLTEDIKLGETILPKGADVIMTFITVHRNEKYWPNPLVFDPDRFLEKKEPFDFYMPFSLGPRNCIGLQYAMMSMKVYLATLIRTFIFKVDKRIHIDKIKLRFSITLKSIKPIKVKIEKRNIH